jgi:hypothetical protein
LHHVNNQIGDGRMKGDGAGKAKRYGQRNSELTNKEIVNMVAAGVSISKISHAHNMGKDTIKHRLENLKICCECHGIADIKMKGKHWCNSCLNPPLKITEEEREFYLRRGGSTMLYKAQRYAFGEGELMGVSKDVRSADIKKERTQK